jgi:hypothetical protein
MCTDLIQTPTMWFVVQGEVKEKSYSVKMLPPPTPGAPYSVEKLIKRASRLAVCQMALVLWYLNWQTSFKDMFNYVFLRVLSTEFINCHQNGKKERFTIVLTYFVHH